MSSAREQPPPPPNYPPPPSRGGSGAAARFAPRRVYAVPSGTGALPDAAIEAALEEEEDGQQLQQQQQQHGAIDDVVVHVAPSPHAPPPLPPMPPPPHARPRPPVAAAAAAAAASSPGGDEGAAAAGAGAAAAPQGTRLQSRPHPQAELKHDARSTGGGDRDGGDGADDDGDDDGALSEAGENAPAPPQSSAAAAAGAAPRETYHDDADLNAPRHAVDDAELLDAVQAHRLALRATRHRDIRLSDAELSVLQFLSDSIRRRATSEGGAFSMPLPRGVHISENVLVVLYARGYMPGTDRRSGEPTLMW